MSDVRRIVAITGDPVLRAAVVRLGALAGASVEVVEASRGARAAWRAADAVVVGADLAEALVAADLGRRSRVAVVSPTSADDRLWRLTVQLGAGELLVLPADERRLVELMAAALEPAAGTSQIIGVIGGCGGAGVSTLAASLALLSGRRRSTVLVDGDRLGGGLDVLLGVEQEPGLRWSDLAATSGRLDGSSISDRLVQVADCRLLSWGRGESPLVSVDATTSTIDALSRAFELVVVDIGRVVEPSTHLLLTASDRLVVLTFATVRAVSATASLLAEFDPEKPVDLVVRDVGGRPLSTAEIARALGIRPVATIQSDSSVAVAAQRGESPLTRSRGSLAKACLELLGTDLATVSA